MAEETTAEAPQITLLDLQNALKIIDIAAERGTFKGNELTSVGGVRDKLASFLEAALPKEEAADGQPDAEGAAPAAAEG